MADYELDSDEWWADFLARKMGAGFKRLKEMQDYRNGTNAMPEQATGATLEQYQRILTMSRLNFAEQIVSSLTSRLRPIGFHTAVDQSVDGDDLAMTLWKHSHMGTQYARLTESKGTYGKGYITILEDPEDPESLPVFAATTPWQTYAYVDETRPWITLAAITLSYNPATQLDTLTLFRPSQTPGNPGYYRQAFKEAVDGSNVPTNGTAWEMDDSWEWDAPKSFEKIVGVPVVEFTTEDGFGLFERHIDTLDRINHTILQRVVITIMQAFRQRAIDGEFPDVYPQNHPRAGEKIEYGDMFKAGPDALWLLPKGAKMWESVPTDIRPIIAAIESDLKHLAAASSTPLYVLSPEAANGSAEGASLARETHTLKAEQWALRDNDALASVFQFGFQAMGDVERGDADQIDVIWRDMSLISAIDRANAAKAAHDAGFSPDTVGEKFAGFTPREVVRERGLRERAGMMGIAGAAPAAIQPTPTSPTATQAAARPPQQSTFQQMMSADLGQ